jgi:hypothetical protein
MRCEVIMEHWVSAKTGSVQQRQQARTVDKTRRVAARSKLGGSISFARNLETQDRHLLEAALEHDVSGVGGVAARIIDVVYHGADLPDAIGVIGTVLYDWTLGKWPVRTPVRLEVVLADQPRASRTRLGAVTFTSRTDGGVTDFPGKYSYQLRDLIGGGKHLEEFFAAER